MIKLFVTLIILTVFNLNIVNASSIAEAKIGDTYYDNLSDAIVNAKSGETIILTSDSNTEKSLVIDKEITLNLNGKTVSAPSSVFKVQGGKLSIDGKGVIKETEPNYGAIMVIGSINALENDYSVVNVGKDVTLEGWSGIFVNHNSFKSHGTEINLGGKINAINDTLGSSGVGIYINGNIQHPDNHPIINILDTAEITSTGTGLYVAGFTTLNIGKATIAGVESGLGIKSGVININGATIYAKGKDTTPTEGYNNGIKSSGAAIQIESNSGYAGNIELHIKNGSFKSKYGNVIYEYIGKGSSTRVNSIAIENGQFISESSKPALVFSDSFTEKHKNFIKGGTFSSDPSKYLKSGYTASKNGSSFEVISTTMKEIPLNDISEEKTTLILKIIIILSSFLIIAYITYLNRYNLLNLLK